MDEQVLSEPGPRPPTHPSPGVGEEVPPQPPEEEPPALADDPPPDAAPVEAHDYQAHIVVTADSVIRFIPRTLYGTNVEWAFSANGLWDPVAQQVRPELVSMTRQSGFALLRFPGGVLSDYYHWKDGVGARQGRAVSEHYPGGPVSFHDFGTDEVMALARTLGSELLITVNAGTGTPEEAAGWVVHVTRSMRASGSPRVTCWEIGNELYVNDGSPTNGPIATAPEVYAQRVLSFAAAMRAVDPSIRIAAIGGESQGALIATGYPAWNETVLGIAGHEIDMLSVHNAYAPLVFVDRGESVREVYEAMLAAPRLVRRNLDTIKGQIDAHVPGRAEDITLAITEWGPFFHALPSSRFVDHVKTLGSALFTASVLKVLIEDPRVEVATSFKLVDNAYMGWIGIRDGNYAVKAPCLAMEMFTRHFGSQVVANEVTSPAYQSSAVGLMDAMQDVPLLETVSSLSDDGRRLFVMVINKSFDEPLRALIDLEGFEAAGGMVHVLAGTAIDANTGTELPVVPGLTWAPQASAEPAGRFHQGNPSEVTLSSSRLDVDGSSFVYEFPAHSVTSLELFRAE